MPVNCRTEKANQHLRGYVAIALASCLFGSTGVVVKSVPWPAAAILVGSLGFAFLALLLWAEIRQLPYKAFKRMNSVVVWLGILLGVDWLLFTTALKLSAVAQVVFLIQLSPVGTAVLARWILDEKTHPSIWIALVLSIVGAFLITAPSFAGSSTVGLVMALGSAVIISFERILVKRVPLAIPSPIVSLHRYAVAAGLILPFAIWQSVQSQEMVWSPRPILLVCLLGLISAFGGTAYVGGLRRVPVHRGAVLSYLEPLSAAVLAQWLLGERIGASIALGGLLIAAGSYIVVRGQHETSSDVSA